MSDQSRQLIPVVILNWNGEADTVECLTSIREGDRAGFVPVLVDNGSTPESVERLKRACGLLYGTIVSLRENDLRTIAAVERAGWAAARTEDALVFIQNAENLGFAKGSNVGIRFAELIGAEWVMLLNNDTVVAPGALRELRRFSRDNPWAVAMTPQIRYPAPSTRIQNCGGQLTYFGSRKYNFAERDASALSPSPYTVVTYATGCALLFKHTVTGALTEDFFFGEEDYEFALRLKKRGLLMACVHGAVAHHKGGASIGRSAKPLGAILLHLVNRLVDLRNYYSWPRWHAARILAYLYLPVLLGRHGMDPRKSLAIIRRIEAYLRDHHGVDRAEFQSMVTSDW